MIFDNVECQTDSKEKLALYAMLTTMLLKAATFKILALSTFPARTSNDMLSLISAFGLEQIVSRRLDDPDVAAYVQSMRTVAVELSGKSNKRILKHNL